MPDVDVSDPFLLAHQAGPRFFDLSGKLSPISIRDQMVRGYLLVDRARTKQLIGPDAPLLVIGAGACGVTAAIHAAELRVPTLLIDKAPPDPNTNQPDTFRLQFHCTTRWIDPAQYDWPMDQWTQASYPWAGVKMPLQYGSGRANQVAQGWRSDLSNAMNGLPPGQLEVSFGTRLAWPPARDRGRLYLLLATPQGQRQFEAGMVVVAAEAGFEETRAYRSQPGSTPPPGTYRGFRFWEDDYFEETQPRSRVPGDDDRVVISGGGDGALQDFLRLMTRKPSAKAIYEACFSQNVGGPASVAESIERAVLCAEERARMATHWGMGGEYDHKLHLELEQVHQTQVDFALKDRQVRSRLDGLLQDRPQSLTLVHACTHFTCMYALNRFLALLILTCMEEEYPDDRPATRIPTRGAIKVDDADPNNSHGCGAPAHCHGKDHLVTLADYNECWGKPGDDLPHPETANVVVIRHGIRPEQVPWLSLTPHANPRHVLPYYLL